MANLQVSLHTAQLKIFNDKHRFKVVAAGRRFGKSRLAAWLLLITALQSTEKDVFYVAPTYQQAKDIIWDLLKRLGADVIQAAHENTGVLTLINGRKIFLKGSDRPDTLRGVGLAYCVIDEYADMKPFVFEQILRPALTDVKGGCLFIGTPKGRNHFYDIYEYAKSGEDDEWVAYHFTSFDNPLLDPEEIEKARKSQSSFAFRQEYMASFEAAASDVFKEDWIKYSEVEPQDGNYFITVDLAGFADVIEQAGNKKSRLDETAIAIVKVSRNGWWVKEIVHGRWDVRETALRMLKACRDVGVKQIGIEKGALKNAVQPYFDDAQRRTQYYVQVLPLTHGNKKKIDRIVWALQGRFEHGKVTLNKGSWNRDVVDQLMQFPDEKSHDDLIDALAYVDQIQTIGHDTFIEQGDFVVFDEDAGY